MRGDRLGILNRAAILEVGGDSGRPEGVIPDPGLDAGGLRPAPAPQTSMILKPLRSHPRAPKGWGGMDPEISL